MVKPAAPQLLVAELAVKAARGNHSKIDIVCCDAMQMFTHGTLVVLRATTKEE